MVMSPSRTSLTFLGFFTHFMGLGVHLPSEWHVTFLWVGRYVTSRTKPSRQFSSACVSIGAGTSHDTATLFHTQKASVVEELRSGHLISVDISTRGKSMLSLWRFLKRRSFSGSRVAVGLILFLWLWK